jgi:hypothetical protein
VTVRTYIDVDDAGAVMRDLRQQIDRSLKVQEEFSRDVGRMRTLVECRAEAHRAIGSKLAASSKNCVLSNSPASMETKSRASGHAYFNCGDVSHFARNCPLHQVLTVMRLLIVQRIRAMINECRF